MIYAKLDVRTLHGWRSAYYAYPNHDIMDRYLRRYYRGKDYYLQQISPEAAAFARKSKAKFKYIT